MNTKLLSIVSAVALTISAGVANAQPVQLTSTQMDKVSAGGVHLVAPVITNTAYASANALAFGLNTKAFLIS